MDSCDSQRRREALVWSLLPWCSSQRALPILLQKSESDAKIWDTFEPYSFVCCEAWFFHEFGTGYCIYLKFPCASSCRCYPSFSFCVDRLWVLGSSCSHSAWGYGCFRWCWWDGQHCYSSGETPLWNTSKLRELIMKILAPWAGSDCSPS